MDNGGPILVAPPGELKRMLINKRTTIAGLLGSAALATSLLTPASPATAHDSWVGPAIGFGAGVGIGSALAAPHYSYGSNYYSYGPDYYSYGPYYGYQPEPYAYGPPRRAYRAYVDPDAWCASRFRSYDPYSHTYLGYDGFRHSCP